MEQTHRYRKRLMVARGDGVRSLGEKGEEIKKYILALAVCLSGLNTSL